MIANAKYWIGFWPFWMPSKKLQFSTIRILNQSSNQMSHIKMVTVLLVKPLIQALIVVIYFIQGQSGLSNLSILDTRYIRAGSLDRIYDKRTE